MSKLDLNSLNGRILINSNNCEIFYTITRPLRLVPTSYSGTSSFINMLIIWDKMHYVEISDLIKKESIVVSDFLSSDFNEAGNMESMLN